MPPVLLLNLVLLLCDLIIWSENYNEFLKVWSHETTAYRSVDEWSNGTETFVAESIH